MVQQIHIMSLPIYMYNIKRNVCVAYNRKSQFINYCYTASGILYVCRSLYDTQKKKTEKTL